MMPWERHKNEEIATWANLIINIGILYLTVKIVEINTRNAYNSGATVEVLKEINQKIERKKIK